MSLTTVAELYIEADTINHHGAPRQITSDSAVEGEDKVRLLQTILLF